jgi:hypothetical protein
MRLLLIPILLVSLLITSCSNDAQVASANLSTDADSFKVNRRIVFYNGITDDYIMTIEGACSITVDSTDRKLDAICKIGNDSYKKHYLGLSDNVTYSIEQLEPVKASAYRYKVIFKPSVVVPDIEVR